MHTVCIQCALRAMLNDEPSPVFEETPEAHQRRVHPDLAATQRERHDLERALQAKLAARPPTQAGDDMTMTIELDGPVTDVEQALAELRANVEYDRLHVQIRVVSPRKKEIR